LDTSHLAQLFCVQFRSQLPATAVLSVGDAGTSLLENGLLFSLRYLNKTENKALFSLWASVWCVNYLTYKKFPLQDVKANIWALYSLLLTLGKLTFSVTNYRIGSNISRRLLFFDGPKISSQNTPFKHVSPFCIQTFLGSAYIRVGLY
jgi:hypothetical protein